MNKFNPAEDGITHINVYSKGRTPLGRFLSNFDHCNIVTEDGYFRSIEGYWYWLGCKNDKLRDAIGFEAKKLGRELGAPDWLDGAEFKRKITNALLIKLQAFPEMADVLVCNKLPLVHYYVYNGKAINVPAADWILEVFRQYVRSVYEMDGPYEF